MAGRCGDGPVTTEEKIEKVKNRQRSRTPCLPAMLSDIPNKEKASRIAAYGCTNTFISADFANSARSWISFASASFHS